MIGEVKTIQQFHTRYIILLCVAVVLFTVLNSTSTNMIYYYHQTSTSDFEQQLDFSIQKHIIFMLRVLGMLLTSVTLTPGAASPTVPHLAADLTLRASSRHPSVRQLAAFTACISRSSSSTPRCEPEISESVCNLPSQQLNECYEGLRVRTCWFVFNEGRERCVRNLHSAIRSPSIGT